MYETVLITIGIVLSVSLALTLALLVALRDYLKGLDFDFTAGFRSLDDEKPKPKTPKRIDISC